MTEKSTANSPLSDEIHTIKLGNKIYAADSLTETGNNIIGDLQKVDSLLAQQKLAVSVSTLAKGALIEKLTAEAVNFTEIEDPSIDPAATDV